MNGISAVIITHNEERNIGRCLDSLRGIADEIVVVDAMSDDRTADICREKAVTLVTRKWEGYAAAKNAGNARASREHILSIDADEIVSKQLAGSILQASAQGLNGAYSFNRRTNYCGRWIRFSGWYPDVKTRLFPKDAGRWVGDYVHETLTLAPGTPTTWLAGDLLHYSYRSVEEHEERIERYSELHARKLLQEGRRSHWLKGLLGPAFKFLQTYVLRLGLLDGTRGFTIARLSAKAVYLKHLKHARLHERTASE